MGHIFKNAGSQETANYLTIDVEEWHQTVMYEDSLRYSKRITGLPENIEEILGLLDKYGAKATFFIVGCLAQKYPACVKSIALRGHEIASHGYFHRIVSKLRREEFFQDIIRAKTILENVSGTSVLGYRACTWSITEKMEWAIDSLYRAGYQYDSSIYPLVLRLYGRSRIVNSKYKIKGDFIEFPPSVFSLAGFNIPFAGGVFLRFFPYELIRHGIEKINRDGHPAIIYFHTWEFDDRIPEGVGLPAWKRFIQYKNLFTVREKFELMLKNFKFIPIAESLTR